MRRELYLPKIEQKVAFLSRPETYPGHVRKVEVKETHMSWVFLTESHAWKLKKPVKYDFLNFSTLQARLLDCEEEIRLNRRMAANVYYGITPLTINSRGGLSLAGEGEPIDWLVKMRRLSDDLMLDRAIANRNISAAETRKVGESLGRFYKRALPYEITASEYRSRLYNNIRSNQQELENPDYNLPSLESITKSQLEFLEQGRELFDQRSKNGKIIEAHGDLRPEHICLEPEPVIIDCLEFNQDFRILDSASELAFLALECERLGAPQVGDLILSACLDVTGDRPPLQSLAFYKSYHACLRAKIAVWHLNNHGNNDRAKWIGKARLYLQMAAGYAHPSSSSTIDPPE